MPGARPGPQNWERLDPCRLRTRLRHAGGAAEQTRTPTSPHPDAGPAVGSSSKVDVTSCDTTLRKPRACGVPASYLQP